MGMDHSLIFVGIAVVIIVMVIAGAMSASRRRKALGTWCQARGLDFDSSDCEVDGMWPQCKIFDEGHARRASNWIEGELLGRHVEAFDYRYTTGSGKNSTTHNLSAIAVKSDVPLLPLHIRPEGLLDKVGTFFGHEDINFESAEFSRRFHVTGERKWAYDVLHQRAIEFLLGAEDRFEIQFDLLHVVLWDHKVWDPPRFEQAARVAAGLLDMLPEYVRKQQTGNA